MYRGDIQPGDILDLKFTTTGASDGAPATLSGTPAVSVYKDNSTTESTAGITLSVDFDGRTGLNNLRIDTSADGTFYAAAHNYQCVITAGTVGGTSAVGYVVGEFSIAHRSTAAIKAKTDNLPSSPAAVSDIPTASQNADALLKRDMSAISGEADRSPLNALRAIRNKTSISGSTMTVTKEDDTSAAWTAAITTDASADPITGIDPA